MSQEASKGFIAPDYLNKNFFKRSLENGFEIDEVEIADFKITLGTQPGDNYTSTIYRARIIYNHLNSKNNEISLIIKSIPIDDARSVIEEFGILDKEIKVYKELLPKLSKILGNTAVAPKCFDIFTEPHRNLVFQDMKALGYVTADRVIGLDEQHLEVALKKVAKFHAASIQLLREDPAIEQHYDGGIFTETTVSNPIFETAFSKNMKLGADILSKIPGYERFREKLMKIYENSAKIALKMVELDPENDIKVLNHGDLWINNFLFKYDEHTKRPTDIVFVDYQGTFFNSLGIDLNYLFITSAQVDVLKRKVELVEKYYYPVFVDTLKSLQIESIPTIQDVTKQLWQREMYSVFCLFGILPIVTINREESKTNDFTQFVDKEKAHHKTLAGMSSRRFIETMKYIMEYLETKIDETIRNY
ncbi:uncharacterized protein LOC119658416 [Hermetia illucens]|nr:uncharacterized protein LOC119658416 [Hermetia illucens]